MTSPDALRAAAAALAAASEALAAAQMILSDIVDETLPAEPRDIPPLGGDCRHLKAMEIQTFGDGAPLWLCPDCDETLS